MTIAFDIDGTWDRDPYCFETFYRLLIGWGKHTCIFVTGREQPADKLYRLRIPKDAVIIVSGPLLKEQAALKAGYKVDVWVDDMPGMIQDCKILGGDL